jgi:hypothetical protein
VVVLITKRYNQQHLLVFLRVPLVVHLLLHKVVDVDALKELLSF